MSSQRPALALVLGLLIGLSVGLFFGLQETRSNEIRRVPRQASADNADNAASLELRSEQTVDTRECERIEHENFALRDKIELISAKLREAQLADNVEFERGVLRADSESKSANTGCHDVELQERVTALVAKLQSADNVRDQVRNEIRAAVLDAKALYEELKSRNVDIDWSAFKSNTVRSTLMAAAGMSDSSRFLPEHQLPPDVVYTYNATEGAASFGEEQSAKELYNGGAPVFKAKWVLATETEWIGMLRRRGCRDNGFRNKIQCCEPELFPNFTTPLRHWLLSSTQSFKVERLHKVLQGGGITFVGDSITSQIYNALVSRAVREKFIMNSTIPLPPMATAASTFLHPYTKQVAFHTALYRIDKANEVESLLRNAIPLVGTMTRYGTHRARQVVVGNVGLHYSDSDADQTEMFKADLTQLISRLREFNKYAGNFGVLRDITPQHFKPRDSTSRSVGSYSKRDLNARACSPWEGTDGRQLSQHRNSQHNELMLEMATEAGLAVQRTVPLLSQRFDAHLETRDDSKHNVLDCTHWCAAVFDVFEDTLLAVLADHWNVAFSP